ncbi:MAG: helix-turn-helix domain-containing protein [Candidatus Onthomonas sp.]
MGNIAARFKEIFDSVGISQSEFARRISVTPAYIWKLLNKVDAVPSDRTISDICREFNISETWFRTGEGEMHLRLSEDSEFMQVMAEIQVSDDSFIKSALKAYWELSDSEKAVIRKLIDGIKTKENAGD